MQQYITVFVVQATTDKPIPPETLKIFSAQLEELAFDYLPGFMPEGSEGKHDIKVVAGKCEPIVETKHDH